MLDGNLTLLMGEGGGGGVSFLNFVPKDRSPVLTQVMVQISEPLFVSCLFPVTKRLSIQLVEDNISKQIYFILMLSMFTPYIQYGVISVLITLLGFRNFGR